MFKKEHQAHHVAPASGERSAGSSALPCSPVNSLHARAKELCGSLPRIAVKPRTLLGNISDKAILGAMVITALTRETAVSESLGISWDPYNDPNRAQINLRLHIGDGSSGLTNTPGLVQFGKTFEFPSIRTNNLNLINLRPGETYGMVMDAENKSNGLVSAPSNLLIHTIPDRPPQPDRPRIQPRGGETQVDLTAMSTNVFTIPVTRLPGNEMYVFMHKAPGTHPHIRLHGPVGIPVTLQSSDDLVNWHDFHSTVLQKDHVVVDTRVDPNSEGRMYYRLRHDLPRS